jgi:hypothetical protein
MTRTLRSCTNVKSLLTFEISLNFACCSSTSLGGRSYGYKANATSARLNGAASNEKDMSLLVRTVRTKNGQRRDMPPMDGHRTGIVIGSK